MAGRDAIIKTSFPGNKAEKMRMSFAIANCQNDAIIITGGMKSGIINVKEVLGYNIEENEWRRDLP